MLKNNSLILTSLVAGVVGGALVALLIFNSPTAAKLLTKDNAGVESVSDKSVGTTENRVSNEEEKLGEAYESLVVAAAEKASPAVVSIVVTKDVPIIERYYEDAPGVPSNPFGDFFGDDNFFSPFSYRVPQYRQRGTQEQEVGGGSGFLVSTDGLIVTNRHVVDQSEVDYTVLMNDGTKFAAEVVARDPVNDLAVIRITGSDLPYLNFADSDQLKVGQTVIAIGNALAEFRNTVSVGVISGLARSITAGNGLGMAEQLDEVIQTDAAINPGNSGGPLLDLHGEVIGVNVAMARGSENIGFALPVNIVRGVVESVKETGKIVRPFLGVRYAMVTQIIKEQNKLPVDYGALVLRGESRTELAVVPGSPADKAGLEEGDIILEIDGVKLDEQMSLSAVIRKKQVGDRISLKVMHEGQEKVVEVTLEEQE